MKNYLRLKMEFGVAFHGIGEPTVVAEFLLKDSAQSFCNLMNNAVVESQTLKGSKVLGGSYSVIEF